MFKQLKAIKTQNLIEAKEKVEIKTNERGNHCHQRFAVSQIRFFKVQYRSELNLTEQ